MANYAALGAEVDLDPLSLGYVAMTDEDLADSLNAITRPLTDPVLSSGDLFQGVDVTEYEALVEPAKGRVGIVLGLGETVHVGPGTTARQVFINAFGPASTTISNLANVLPKQSRADEIGFGALVKPQDVTRVRP